MEDFTREISCYRYRDTQYFVFVEAYRDGFGIFVENSGNGLKRKYFAGRECRDGVVIWSVGGAAGDILPGTEMTSRELLRKFLEMYEAPRQIIVSFG